MAAARDGKRGSDKWRENIVVENRAEGRNLGRKELEEAILIAGAAIAIVNRRGLVWIDSVGYRTV